MTVESAIKVAPARYEKIRRLAEESGRSMKDTAGLLLDEGISSATELGKAKANPGSNALAGRLAELEATVASFEAEKTRVSSDGRLAGRVADLEASVEDLEAEATGENSEKRLAGPGGKELPPGYKGLTIKPPDIHVTDDDEKLYSCADCGCPLDADEKLESCPQCGGALSWDKLEESGEEGSGGKTLMWALGGLALLAVLRGGIGGQQNTRGSV